MFLLTLSIFSWWKNTIPVWVNVLIIFGVVFFILVVCAIYEKITNKNSIKKNAEQLQNIFIKYKNKYRNIDSNSLIKNQLLYLQQLNLIKNINFFANETEYVLINIIDLDKLVLNMFIFNNQQYSDYNFEWLKSELAAQKKFVDQISKLIENRILVFNNLKQVNIINCLLKNNNLNIIDANNVILLNLKLISSNVIFHNEMFLMFMLKLLKIKLQKNQLLIVRNIDEEFENIREKNLNLQKINKPVFGIYNNFFGSKQSIRMRTLVYVEEKSDSCPLCRPFENQILSLEEYDTKYLTMYEAMSQGFHHLGCTHNEIDYLPNNTVIPPKRFTVEMQNKNYDLKKQEYRYNFDILNLKLEINNSQNIEDNKKLLIKLNLLEEEFLEFLNKNNLELNKNKLNEFDLFL